MSLSVPPCACVQMCHVLQYLCDCQVRHRIEALVAFSDDFVACLQENQRFRYNEVMLALNMSAALTAKKTKEFRSPPQEQVAARLYCNLTTFSNFCQCDCRYPFGCWYVSYSADCVCSCRSTRCLTSRMTSKSVPALNTSENSCWTSTKTWWDTVVLYRLALHAQANISWACLTLWK